MPLLGELFELLLDIWRILVGSLSRGAPWMSRLGRTIFGGLYKALPGVVVQLLFFFGLTLAVNHFVVPEARDLIAGFFTGLPESWVNFIALTRIDQATTVLLSAMAIATARRVRLKPANPSLWS